MRKAFARRVTALAAALIFACLAPLASAQDYPSRPVKILIAFAPGGPTDIVGRLIAMGFIIVASTPEQTGVKVRTELDKWARVVKAGNIKPEPD